MKGLLWLLIIVGLFGLLFLLDAFELQEFGFVLLDPSLIDGFGTVAYIVTKLFAIPAGE